MLTFFQLQTGSLLNLPDFSLSRPTMLLKGEIGRGSVYPRQSYVPSALRISKYPSRYSKYTYFQMLPKTTVLTLSGGGGGGGGGGGFRGPDGQTHSCQSEASYFIMPKLGDF